MQRWILTIPVAGMLALVFCGCGDKPLPASDPHERNSLVIRMFQSFRKGDNVQAAAQAGKLSAIFPDNVYLKRAVETQQANIVIAQAQKHLDAGRFAEARKILWAASAEYPANPFLKEASDRMEDWGVWERLTAEAVGAGSFHRRIAAADALMEKTARDSRARALFRAAGRLKEKLHREKRALFLSHDALYESALGRPEKPETGFDETLEALRRIDAETER